MEEVRQIGMNSPGAPGSMVHDFWYGFPHPQGNSGPRVAEAMEGDSRPGRVAPATEGGPEHDREVGSRERGESARPQEDLGRGWCWSKADGVPYSHDRAIRGPGGGSYWDHHRVPGVPDRLG